MTTKWGTPGIRDAKNRLIYVGHYGCSVADRIVKVRPPLRVTGRPHALESWKITCPACGEVHVVRPMWRPALKWSELDRSEMRMPKHTTDGSETEVRPYAGRAGK